MLYLIVVLVVISLTSAVQGVSYYRVNSKGSTGWKSGVNCLKHVASAYLQNSEYIQRPTVLSLSHIFNLSSPAAEIEENFLITQNERINCRNCSKEVKKLIQTLTITADTSTFLPVENVSQYAILVSDFYILVTDNVNRLEDFIRNYLSKTISWNPAAKFLILYNNIKNYDNVDNITQELFEKMLENFYVNNVILLFARNATSYDVMQLLSYSKQKCRSVQVRKFKSCYNGKFLSDFDLMEISVKTAAKNVFIENCKFKVCCKVAKPFVGKNCLNGLEIKLLEMIKEKMNFHMEKYCENKERGILENNSWTGLLGMLENGDCDFIIGGFYPDNEVRQYFWVTDPYLSDAYTWYVNKAQLQPAWKGLISIYAWDTWYLLVFALLITWITWFTLGKLHQQENQEHMSISLTALNNLGVILGFSVNERPVHTPLKIFFIALTLFGLNMTGIYTSNLIAVFTNPKYDDQITSMKEVLKRGIPFGGPKENRDWFKDDSDKILYELYNDTEKFESNSANFKHVAKGERVLLANKMFALQSSHSDKIYGFRDYVFASPIEMIMRRGFPVLKQFNDVIRKLRANGYFQKIYNEFYFKNTLLKYIKERRQDEGEIF